LKKPIKAVAVAARLSPRLLAGVTQPILPFAPAAHDAALGSVAIDHLLI
jgi:hypothetical protein